MKVKTQLPRRTIRPLESRRPKCAYDKSMSLAIACVCFTKWYGIQNRKLPYPKSTLLFAKNWNVYFIILCILLATWSDFWIQHLICHCQGLTMNQICKVYFSICQRKIMLLSTLKHLMTLGSFLKKKKAHCQTN